MFKPEEMLGALYAWVQKKAEENETITESTDVSIKKNKRGEFGSKHNRKHYTHIMGKFIVRATRDKWKMQDIGIESEGVMKYIDVSIKRKSGDIFRASQIVSQITRRFCKNNKHIGKAVPPSTAKTTWQIVFGEMPQEFFVELDTNWSRKN